MIVLEKTMGFFSRIEDSASEELHKNPVGRDVRPECGSRVLIVTPEITGTPGVDLRQGDCRSAAEPEGWILECAFPIRSPGLRSDASTRMNKPIPRHFQANGRRASFEFYKCSG